MSPLFEFPDAQVVTLLRREKRFLVEVQDARGIRFWVHTNNSGSMLGLTRPTSTARPRAIISDSHNPKRKMRHTLECVEVDGSHEVGHPYWACVNTQAPNKVLYNAFDSKCLPELARATALTREATVGQSRLDARFETPDGPLWVECKNVTLVEDGVAIFPDAVTTRGQKHLRELTRLAGEGVRVATFYLVSMADAQCFGPADVIDPEYARLFYEARKAGVQTWAWAVRVDETGVRLSHRLQVIEG